MRLNVPANERGQVRIFAIDLPADDARALVDAPEQLAAALGVRQLDLSYVDLIELDALEGIGLFGYLQDGIDIAPEALTQARDQLDKLEGHVAIILSKAFDGAAVDSPVQPPLRLITTLPEAQADHSAGDLKTDPIPAQKPEKPPKSEAAISGMVATYVLIGFFIFTALFVWFAG